MYQEILSKESENLQNLRANIQEENEPEIDGENDAPRDELNRERSRLEQQLPVKLELLELQRKRCRDHKAASLVLEQAVAALETAAQEQETLLVSGNYIQRKSSWSSIEEGEGNSNGPITLYRQKFLNDRNSKICYHSLKDHPKVSKIAKFRCEML